MDSLLEKISLREILKAFLPAFYFIIFLIPIVEYENFIKAINYNSLDIYSLLLITIFTTLLGILISAIDLPKHFFLFRNILSNRRVAKEMGCLKKPHAVDVNYYLFCNIELTAEEKSITQKYTNIIIAVLIWQFLLLFY